MVQWPPSPIVEDEAAALAKEHGSGRMKEELKTEDQLVPSRGSVDQYPIICDSQAATDANTPVNGPSLPSRDPAKPPKRADPVNEPPTYRDGTGLHTPPPSDTESRGRASHLKVTDNQDNTSSTRRSKSAVRVDEAPESRPRPTMSRIQTDVSGDLERMKAGTRRAPSPYSYTRETGTFRVDLDPRRSTDQFLSPNHATESPLATQLPKLCQEKHRESREYDSSTDSERRPKKSLRFADKPLGPAPPSQPRKSFSLPESRSRETGLLSAETFQSDDRDSRQPRRHHEHANNVGRDGPESIHRSRSRASRSSSKPRDSPHSSSAEESMKPERSRSSKEPSPNEKPARRRSSHRRERPRLEEPLNHILAHARTDSSDDDTLRRVYRVRDRRTPMTPPSVTTPNHMEDYFSKAFHDNAMKGPQHTSRSSADDTAVFSPPNSPPRTPRTERLGRQEYFESPSSSPHRTPRGSRPPSLEESQIRDLRAHHSLLSQATAGAAAVAARISPPATRSPSTIDAAFDNPNHVIVTKSRSRPSSPVREMAKQGSRAEQSVHTQPKSRPSSPQRESLKPVIHRADTVGYSQPRSRPPSPQREFSKPLSHRTDSLNPGYPKPRASSTHRNPQNTVEAPVHGEPATTRTYHSVTPQTKRPSTREGLPKIEQSTQASPNQPQRTASWTGFEQPYRTHVTQFGGPLHAMTAMSNTLPSAGLKVPPPLIRSQSAVTAAEIVQKSDDFGLPPCPRPHPTQGLRDWVTIKDVPNFDLCPKCVHALASTQYRTLLVRSLDKPYNKNTVCALSKPWLRIAVIRTIKQNKVDLSLIRDANTLAAGARPCEGSEPDIRQWWRIPDPSTDRSIPDFFACSACIGSVHTIFPELKFLFTRDSLNHEKVCDLRCNGKNFNILAQQIEHVADKCRDRGKSSVRYLQPLIDVVKHIDHRECTRDRLLTSRAWHYMDQFPEFTVCEECFEEVVWPLKDKPYARDISKTLKLIPESTGRRFSTQLTSCQLYSGRMRGLFKDVVSGQIAWDTFKSKARERQSAQFRLFEMNRMYDEDQRLGWDRRSEIEKNRAYWRSLE